MQQLMDKLMKCLECIYQVIDKDPSTFKFFVAMGVIAFALYVVMKIVQSLS
jgi:hypothetical protein